MSDEEETIRALVEERAAALRAGDAARPDGPP